MNILKGKIKRNCDLTSCCLKMYVFCRQDLIYKIASIDVDKEWDNVMFQRKCKLINLPWAESTNEHFWGYHKLRYGKSF